MKKLIIITGPTGIGKTDLSIDIAKQYNTVIISADSRQLYKELLIGTAPPSNEQLNEVVHYFISTKSIHDNYNAGMYEMDVIELLSELFKKNDYILLVGGSGMYIDAVCNGIDDLPKIDNELRHNLLKQFETEGIASIRFTLKKIDPKSYFNIDLTNSKRILKALEVTIQTGKPYSSFLKHTKKERNFETIKIALNRNRDDLFQNINKRVDKMVKSGLVEECRELYKYKNLNALNTVGYKELFAHFDGEYNEQTAIELIKRNSRRYARRQITWLNKAKDYNWFEPEEKNEIFEFCEKQIPINQ